MSESRLEATFAYHLAAAGLIVGMEREYKFYPGRQFRFDFAWPARKCACEIEGGIWSNGRHTRGSGFSADVEKYNLAVIDGWRVVRVTGATIETGEALETVERLLEACA